MDKAVDTKAGTLYVLATPIGNLSDITLRGLEIMKQTWIIYAEDTRVTRKLLDHFDIKSSLNTLNQHSSDKVFDDILLYLLNNNDVVYVSDAGTPGIADPVARLINYISEVAPQVKIIPIPGASALTTAVSVAGLKQNAFVFLGFLPKKKRQALFTKMMEIDLPFVFFASPYRFIKDLEDVATFFGPETNIFVARELTKIYETLYRGTVKTVLNELTGKSVKGEIVCIANIKNSKNTA